MHTSDDSASQTAQSSPMFTAFAVLARVQKYTQCPHQIYTVCLILF